MAPLKDVCNVLTKYGGHAGDTAGIHIHASMRDVNMRSLAEDINVACSTGKWNALMKAVSLRNNLERFNRYANLSEPASSHHAGISYNGHGTVEFRIFNSSTDYRQILKMIKFVKETFSMFITSQKRKFSPEVAVFIDSCAKSQLEKGFITQDEYDLVTKEFVLCA